MTENKKTSLNLSGIDRSKWKTVKLGDVAKFEKGEQMNRSSLNNVDIYPVYNGGVNPSGYSPLWNTEKNTLIISEGGNSCGYVNFIKTRFWRGGHCYKVYSRIAWEHSPYDYYEAASKASRDRYLRLDTA